MGASLSHYPAEALVVASTLYSHHHANNQLHCFMNKFLQRLQDDKNHRYACFQAETLRSYSEGRQLSLTPILPEIPAAPLKSYEGPNFITNLERDASQATKAHGTLVFKLKTLGPSWEGAKPRIISVLQILELLEHSQVYGHTTPPNSTILAAQ